MHTPRPKVTTSLRPNPGRYRRRINLASQPDQAGQLPVIPGGRIVLNVAYGLQPEDAAMLITVAGRIRTAATVEILGRTPKAVADAKDTLAAAWDIGDLVAPGGDRA